MEAGAALHGVGRLWTCCPPSDGNCWALEMFPVKGLAATAWGTTVGAVVILDSITGIDKAVGS